MGNQTIIESQPAQKRSIEDPDQLKQVENNKKWNKFTNLKPGTNMTYKGRQYSEKDEQKLMKAIIAQIKSYRLDWAKKVSLAAICLVAGSASFGLREN